jgi:hypothetical protein
MRAAILLSTLFMIGGIAALFGVPGVHVGNQFVVGVKGLLAAMMMAAVPPVLVLVWRKLQKR